jgi:DNA-binding NarL/FixJ family response regulator
MADAAHPGTRLWSLLIVSTVRLYREGMEASFAGRPEFTIAGAASTPEEALALIERCRPQVAIIDMANRDSLDIVRRMSALDRDLLIVGFGVDEVVSEIVTCAEAGLAGYVPGDASLDELMERVERVCLGELLCSPRVAAGLFRRLSDGHGIGTESRTGAPDLTPREMQVWALIKQGQSNKMIARTLGIEVSTVKNHVHNLLDKLKVATRAPAARLETGAIRQPGAGAAALFSRLD